MKPGKMSSGEKGNHQDKGIKTAAGYDDRYDIIDHINDIVCEVDESGIYTYVNRKFTEILGYQPDEVIGKPAISLIHPEDLDPSTKKYEEVKQKLGKSVDIWRFRNKAGEYLVIESKGSVFVDKETGQKRTVVIGRDLTEQLKIETAREKSEQKFRILHETLMDGFAYVTMDGRIQEFNSTYQKMLGYSPSELLNLHYEDITPDRWHAFEKKIIEEQVLPLGYSEVYQKEYIRKDNVIFPVELRIYLIKDENQQPQGMWAIIRDISARKIAEEQLSQLNTRLVESNATKDKLLSIIAHDLRNPFNTIIGFSELLKSEVGNSHFSAIEDFANRINKEAKRSYYLLDNLLTWANTQTDKMELVVREIHLSTVASEVVGVLRTTAEQKNIELIVESSLNTKVNADLQMVRIILRNLLSNAIKFTRKGGEIKLYAFDREDCIELVVEDNGIGMSLALQRKLFSKDLLKSKPGTANEKGSGLGLWICHELVERHEGRLWVESEPEAGSRFHFTLPLRRD